MRTTLFLASSLFIGCTTGNNLPTALAETTCSSLFTCVDNSLIETFLNYDNEEECFSEMEKDFRDSDEFKDFEKGDKEFNRESAQACLDEIEEVKDDPDCDGEMNPLVYLQDISSEDCDEIYQ
jgi:hypothetical protein